jgi:hypothetical protein
MVQRRVFSENRARDTAINAVFVSAEISASE